MNHTDFVIGGTFWCSGMAWRCTDIGTRAIVAIRIDSVDSVETNGSGPLVHRTLTGREAAVRGWFNGPPYSVAENVFDEYDQEGCSPEPDPDDAPLTIERPPLDRDRR
jgi:hypothetical protein